MKVEVSVYEEAFSVTVEMDSGSPPTFTMDEFVFELLDRTFEMFQQRHVHVLKGDIDAGENK